MHSCWIWRCVRGNPVLSVMRSCSFILLVFLSQVLALAHIPRNGNNFFVTVGTNASGQLVTSAITKQTLPQTVSLTYDFNGNLTGDGQRQFGYDDQNQLTSIWVPGQWRSEFAYDGLGRRRITRDYAWASGAWVKTNEVRYVCDRMLVLQERDDSNVPRVTYTRGLDLSGTMQGAGGIGGLLARTDGNGTAYYHADAQGNISALTDSSGTVLAHYLYDPYGRLLAQSGALAGANRYRYSSKEEHHSGIYYYGFRFYEPSLQRWLNEDPLREQGGLNLYSFVGNLSINGVDPFGLDAAFSGSVGMFAGLTDEEMVEASRSASSLLVPFGASFIPGVGEVMDAQVLNDPNAARWERWLAGASLALSAVTEGFTPNAGSLIQPLRRACKNTAEAAAKGADAAAALRSKLSALENAQQTAARTRTLPDGRIRYYGAETAARTPGPTRGASYVTEHNPSTGQVRSWMESYDQAGNVTRVHPKMIDGQPVNLPHYPPTGKELGQ